MAVQVVVLVAAHFGLTRAEGGAGTTVPVVDEHVLGRPGHGARVTLGRPGPPLGPRHDVRARAWNVKQWVNEGERATGGATCVGFLFIVVCVCLIFVCFVWGICCCFLFVFVVVLFLLLFHHRLDTVSDSTVYNSFG